MAAVTAFWYITLMLNRAGDWLSQAQRNLEQAQASIRDTRHSGHSEGAPYHHYGPIQSGEAVRYAGEIFAFVHHQRERRALPYDPERLPVPAGLLVYTLDEWSSLSASGSRFARTIAREMIWV